MPYQPVPDTALFRIITQAFGGATEWVNDIYVRNTVLGWNAVHLAATGTVIGNTWRDDLMPEMCDDHVFDKVECRDLGVEFGSVTDVEYNTAGSSSAAPLTGALAIYVEFHGSGGAPPRRGGNFVSGLGEDAIAGDQWGAGTTANVQTAYQNITSAIQAQLNGDAMVIVSRYSKNAVPTPPHKRDEAVTNTIASFEAHERVATQRDRRVGEGS